MGSDAKSALPQTDDYFCRSQFSIQFRRTRGLSGGDAHVRPSIVSISRTRENAAIKGQSLDDLSNQRPVVLPNRVDPHAVQKFKRLLHGRKIKEARSFRRVPAAGFFRELDILTG